MKSPIHHPITKHPSGFAAIEMVAAIVLVAAVVGIGGYVYHVKNAANKTLSTTSASPAKVSSPAPATAYNDTSLQSDLNSANAANGQSTQDMTAASASLNDQSTFTTAP